MGSALIQVGTVMAVGFLGGDSERRGFALFALIVAVIFVIAELTCTLKVREHDIGRMETSTIPQMFKALFRNDQAMITVLAILMINSALYLTSNLVIYFFKYDFGGAGWKGSYTLFTMVGGVFQILGMMVAYPLLRKKFGNTQIFKGALGTAMLGYALILAVCFAGFSSNMVLICVCGALVFAANGILTVLTTVFLSNSVDYGELKSGRREESVIFSMQTFVVKAASGLAVFITGIGIKLIGLVGDTEDTGEIIAQSASTITGLRLLMTVLPIIGLVVAFFFFVKKFNLTDRRVEEITETLKAKREAK